MDTDDTASADSLADYDDDAHTDNDGSHFHNRRQRVNRLFESYVAPSPAAANAHDYDSDSQATTLQYVCEPEGDGMPASRPSSSVEDVGGPEPEGMHSPTPPQGSGMPASCPSSSVVGAG